MDLRAGVVVASFALVGCGASPTEPLDASLEDVAREDVAREDASADGAIPPDGSTDAPFPEDVIAETAVDVGVDAGSATPSACDLDPVGKGITPAWGDPEPACVATYDVGTQVELDARIGKAIAGDCIVVADGSYAIGAIEVAGSAAHPVVLRARNRGRAVFSSGTFTTSAKTSHLVVSGFDWTSSGPLRIQGCDHCRITRNRIHLTEAVDQDWIVMTNTTYARVDHNEIGPKAHTGNPLSIFGTGGSVATHTRIDHNWIHDLQTGGDYPSKGCNFNPGGEAIRVGVGSLSALSAETIVEYNLFENCDGDPELISTKTSDNVVRYNTVRNSAGSISLRAGDRVRVCGNVVLGRKKACSGGIRLCGAGHFVYDNYVQGVDANTLELHSGDATHASVTGATVVFNTLRAETNGLALSTDSKDIVIVDNLLTSVGGSLIKYGGGAPPSGWLVGSNLAPRGGATLGVTGAAWTTAFVDLDPKLVARGELSVLGPASTNAIGKADKAYAWIGVDLDGQPRDGEPDLGADEYGTSAIVRAPLTAVDVGPAAP